ncbi:hypothetical protein GCM10022197_41050 [Microlunatus spumicola]|uniref:Right handed beta helix domain-containing protein n=1 Tax=Microlunatus spumicola TaxID=81499 RepID=A0ABP6Y8Z7_9ACTN
MRRSLTIFVFLVLAALLGGSLAAGAATPNDTTCRKVVKSTKSPSQADLLKYSACRFDMLDARVAALAPVGNPPAPNPPVPSSEPKPSATPTPTSPPSTTSPGPTGSGDMPTAGSTGVPSGTTLTAYSGPATITTPGTVIDGKRITSCIVVKADDVTIRNSLIQSKGCFFNVLSENGSTGLQLVDVEIDGQGNGSGDSAVNGAGYTCLRCDVHGTIDGFKVGSNVVIQDSYIHDLVGTSDSHNDGIQVLAGKHIKIQHNSILIGLKSATSGILVKADFGAISDLVIERNLLAGGAWTLYAGSEEGNGGDGPATGVTVKNNQFSTRYFSKGGAFGPLTDTLQSYAVAGNVWADGPGKGTAVS